jgi:polar amino acid transport system substrate-binding protein
MPTDNRLAAIADAGTLRIGLFPSFFYRRDPESGDFSGWGIEMARALSGRLGVGLELVERSSPPAVVACLRSGECDAAFLGISADRATEVDFTPAWAEAEFTFLLPPGATATSIPEADRPRARVAVVSNHAMDFALRGKLQHAERVYAETPDAAFELLREGKADVLAGIRPGLVGYAERMPGARVLPDRYGANVLGMAVTKGETAWLAYLSAFVAETKASGAAREAAAKVGAVGLEIVSP